MQELKTHLDNMVIEQNKYKEEDIVGLFQSEVSTRMSSLKSIHETALKEANSFDEYKSDSSNLDSILGSNSEARDLTKNPENLRAMQSKYDSEVTAGYDALNLVAGDEIRASLFFKGIKTAAEASETIAHILNKAGKLGKVLPFISAILAIGDLTEGTKGLMDESKEDWEEYQKTGDLADYAGNQTTTVIDNVIDIVAGGLVLASGAAGALGLIATAPAWATGLGIAATVAGGVWLFNTGVEWSTGKSLGEWSGDIVRGVGDAVENTWNAASDALNDVGSSIGNLFGW